MLKKNFQWFKYDKWAWDPMAQIYSLRNVSKQIWKGISAWISKEKYLSTWVDLEEYENN